MREDMMKNEDTEKLSYYGKRYSFFLCVTVIMVATLFVILGNWAYIPVGIVYSIAMWFAIKIEKIKKANDIQTYKEIKAFSKGCVLSDEEKRKEVAKRPYEKLMIVLVSVLIVVIVSTLIGLGMHIFLN